MFPTGTVTFLFTDLEGSTQLWEAHRDAMPAALARHDALLRRAVEAHNGAVVKTTGDGLHAAFASAADAAQAAVAAQQALQAEAWLDTGPLRVRMALHTGEAQLRDGDYYGPALNRAARLLAAAHGGQILLSAVTAGLVRDQLDGAGRLTDLGEHRLRDLVATEHVYQLDGPGLPADFPPIASLAAFAHNLPVQVTSFVGREREMAEVKRLLTTTRLLTLTGVGGTGKTRLALQVAADLLAERQYPGGAWLVELAPLSDPALIEQAIATALRVQGQPGRSLDEVLTDYIRYKRLLLVLDNCEHVVDGCARVADRLLHACAELSILATGREALAIAGEVTFQVPSMPVPPVPGTDVPPTVEALAGYGAVRLFVERAQAARPDFRLTAANAEAVAQVCRRLDGIPLAIELAAARIKVLPPEQIASRLNDRFRLLTGGSRTALPRQQTLQALIDWSWELLPESERCLLRRLSVFAGGWTLEAAEAVAGDAGEPLDVLEGLAQLVNKSLVVMCDETCGEGRYRLLETIRQYARDRLVAAEEGEALRDRHAEFFRELAVEAEPHLLGRDMVAWLDRLDTERDNLRAALEWTLEGRPAMALELVAVLELYWLRRSLNVEARRAVEQALASAATLPETQANLTLRARAQAMLGAVLLAHGDIQDMVAATAAGAALARQAAASRALARNLAMMALGFSYLARPDAVRPAAEEAAAIAREHGYTWELTIALSAVAGLGLYGDGDLDEARACLAEIDRVRWAEGNPWSMAMSMMALARLASRSGDMAEAEARYRQAAALFGEIGDRAFVTVTLSDLAHTLRRQGEEERALDLYRHTLKQWQKFGNRAAIAHQLESLAMIGLKRGQPARAARLLGTAETLREATGSVRLADEQAEFDAAMGAARDRLGESAWAGAQAEGRAMAVDRAVAYALEEGIGEQITADRNVPGSQHPAGV